jgi:cell division transport system permease protein
MRVLRILGRNVRDAFKSVFRNFSLSLASISCIAITLIVVSISMILSANVNNFANMVKKDVTIITYLQQGVTEEEIKSLEENIKKLDNIESITFRSKMENMQDLMNENEVFNNIMKDWTKEETSILDTYLVKVKDVTTIKATADAIKTLDHVKTANYGEEMVEDMIEVFDAVKNISYGTFVALVIVTAFLISNTIKITIFSN